MGHLTSGKGWAGLGRMEVQQPEELESMKSQVAALELDLSEQAITNSATNGHLERGVATAKQDPGTRLSCAAIIFSP